MPFSRYPSGSCPCQVSLPFELRHFPAGSLSPLSRIEFVSYRLVVLLRLLPTPPHDDAVAVEYGPENVCPVETFTLLFKCAYERTGSGFHPANLFGPQRGLPQRGDLINHRVDRGANANERAPWKRWNVERWNLERWNLEPLQRVCRPEMARDRVTSSAYSMSLPTGIPKAMRDTMISMGLIKWLR